MIVVIAINCLAVFFAWLESAGIFKQGLKLALFTVFIFLAMRYNYGNDYMGYYEMFHDINNLNALGFDLQDISKELGWATLNRIFAPFGFFAMVAFLAAFSCIILYRFIKNYVPREYYWFAIFFYVFQPYNMLVFSTAMRQAVSISIFLLAIDFIVKKQPIRYLIAIFIATLFHRSAYFLFPFVLLGYFNWKISYAQILPILVLFLVPIFFLKETFATLSFILTNYLDTYKGYVNFSDSTVDIGIGFLIIVAINLVIINYARKQENQNGILFKIAIISFLMVPLSFSISMIGRLNFYLQPVSMAVYPIVFKNINRKEMKLLYCGILCAFTLLQFFLFFRSDVWGLSFGQYHTILSAPVVE